MKRTYFTNALCSHDYSDIHVSDEFERGKDSPPCEDYSPIFLSQGDRAAAHTEGERRGFRWSGRTSSFPSCEGGTRGKDGDGGGNSNSQLNLVPPPLHPPTPFVNVSEGGGGKFVRSEATATATPLTRWKREKAGTTTTTTVRKWRKKTKEAEKGQER